MKFCAWKINRAFDDISDSDMAHLILRTTLSSYEKQHNLLSALLDAYRNQHLEGSNLCYIFRHEGAVSMQKIGSLLQELEYNVTPE